MIDNPKKNSDPTEHWLRQNFSEIYKPEAPENAWERLEPHLRQKKDRYPIFIYWLIAICTTSTMAFSLSWKSGKSIDTNTIVKSCRQESDNLPKIIVWAPSVKSGQYQTLNKINTQEIQPIRNIINHESIKIIFVDQRNNSVQTSVTNNKFQPSFISFSEIKLESRSNLPSTDKIPSLKPKPIINSKTQKFWLGIEIAPFLLINKQDHRSLPKLAFEETLLKPVRGFEAGILLAFQPIKNWRLQIGIQNLRYQFEATHSPKLRLMDGLCLNPQDPGLKEYEFNYALISGINQVSDITLRLHQQDINSTMLQDESFVLDMKTLHQNSIWRIPLLIERQFDIERLHFFIRSGPAIDLIEKNKILVTHFSEACKDLCFLNDHLPMIKAQDQRKINIGWHTGAGIESEISKNLIVRFEPFILGSSKGLQGGFTIGALFSH